MLQILQHQLPIKEFCITLLCVTASQVFAQTPNFATVIGRVEDISRDPNRVVIVCTKVIKGSESLVGNRLDATKLAEFIEDSVSWPRSRSDFFQGLGDGVVRKGSSYVFDIVVEPSNVEEARPLRRAGWELAKQEFGKRYKYIYDRVEPLTKAEREEIEAEFFRSRPRFWSDHIEGASLEPRTDFMLGYLLSEEEKETGREWALKLVGDKKIDPLTRSSIVIAMIRKTREFALDERAAALLDELRKNANTAEDATALKAMLDAICGAYVSAPAKIPPVDEIILEALDPSKRNEEYRLAFARRLRPIWRNPFRKPAYEAMLKVLETESVGSPNKLNPGIPDAVGDWVLFRLTSGYYTLDAKRLGLEKIDHSKLHPTVQARLDIPDAKAKEEGRRKGN